MKNLILLISTFILITSCKKVDSSLLQESNGGEKNEEITKENNNNYTDRLEAFLDSPLVIKKDGHFDLNDLAFEKKYKTFDTNHFNRYRNIGISEKDTLSMFSTIKDTIHVLKNHYLKEIIFFRVTTDGFRLNDDIVIGMTLSDFTNYFGSELNGNDSLIEYEDEFHKINFIFNKKFLKEVFYEKYLE